ncbi:hypothetical protein NP493_40g03012 [Ridgeia piscesae]|uniref:Uncharacterized protein n=1 Tax=Ridgeia piscesae TaxID=27915 RepID=A0AAD9PC09_RIDPI|nr:hypothetical protein NP493_40g03012 [Ridgeia piscesae]
MRVLIDTVTGWQCQWQQRQIYRTLRLPVADLHAYPTDFSFYVLFCSVGASRSTLTNNFGSRTVSLKKTDASLDIYRSHDAPLPTVPTWDDRRSRIGVSVAIR